MAYKYAMEPYVPTAADRAAMAEKAVKWNAAVAQYEADKDSATFSTMPAPGSNYPDRYYFAGEEFYYSGENALWTYYTSVSDPTRKRLVAPDFGVFNATEFEILEEKQH